MRALRILQELKDLSKSGIVLLVCISVLGGFVIAQSPETPLNLINLACSLFGVLLLASGSSALNQLQERVLDAKMARTSSRPLPAGRLTGKKALIFILCSTGIGLLLLSRLSREVFVLGIAAIVFYNGFYTLWWKKRWPFAAVPGAIPGAIPIWIGALSARNELFHPVGVYLFFFVFFWQMPHFWVLALRYKEDYRRGGIPTLPVAHGAAVTVFHIQLWLLAYIALVLIAPFFLKVRAFYLIIAFLMSVLLLLKFRAFARAPESGSWLGFFIWVNFSLVILLAAAVIDLWSWNFLASWIAKG